MVQDTEMTDAEKAKPDDDKKKEEEQKPPVPPLIASARRLERLLGGGGSSGSKKDNTDNSANNMMMSYAYTNPAKVVRRWLGTSSGAAGGATVDDIKAAAKELLDPNGTCAAGRNLLLGSDAAVDASSPDAASDYLDAIAAPNVESWLLSLAVRVLHKQGNPAQALELAQQSITIMGQHLERSTLQSSSSSLFPLYSRMYRLRALAAELATKEGGSSTLSLSTLRADMAKAHNMASLRRDVDTQATLLNCMLRDLLQHSDVEQAEKLLANSTFPEAASNNQFCRYLYYSGRIHALRLEYSTAFSQLSQSLRKAPTNTGVGFRITVQRLLVVVQLLMGEIPDRHVFLAKGMKAELLPYLHITQAVRRGDLAVYTNVVSEHQSRLQTDGMYTLISRLAHQVVKAGLRNLNISYSRLSLQDVADRLGLPSAQSAEFVVAKAVRDGVLDATIHHDEAYVQSHDLVNVYATKEPSEAFHRRIVYCLTTHNDAVRGMRYPPDAYKKQLEKSRGGRRKRGDDKTDEEKAQELEEEFEEDY